MSDNKKTIKVKKYSVSIKSTNGTVISAIGPNASVTITNRINVGGVPHYYCDMCNKHHPIEYKHQSTS